MNDERFDSERASLYLRAGLKYNCLLWKLATNLAYIFVSSAFCGWDLRDEETFYEIMGNKEKAQKKQDGISLAIFPWIELGFGFTLRNNSRL